MPIMTRRAFALAALAAPLAPFSGLEPALPAPATYPVLGPRPAEPDPSPTPGSDDPALKQTVSEQEEIVRGETVVLSEHHVDIGPRLIDGEWILAMRDDTQSTPRWRMPEDVVLQVHDTGQIPVPEGEEYSFLGAKPGTNVYVIPQTEIAGVIWLGWNTQDPAVVKAAKRDVVLRVHSATGPGAFTLFLQPGNFAPPQVLAESSALASKPADIHVDPNTHTHANWVFTKPGIYQVELETLTELASGGVGKARGTFTIAVGDSTDVNAAHAMAQSAKEKSEAGDAHGASDGGGKAGVGAGSGSGAGASDGASSSNGAGAGSSGGKEGADTSQGQGGSASGEGSKPEDEASLTPWLVAGGVAAVGAAGAAVYGAQKKRSNAAAREARASVAESTPADGER